MTDALSEIARQEKEMKSWPRCCVCFGHYMNRRQLALHLKEHTVLEFEAWALAVSMSDMSFNQAKDLMQPKIILGDNQE